LYLTVAVVVLGVAVAMLMLLRPKALDASKTA
jgi:hypothetical protein